MGLSKQSKEVYIQQSFGSYKGKLVVHNLSLSVYLENIAHKFQDLKV